MKLEYENAKSICECGHIGDGLGSLHLDRVASGHGPCIVKGCECNQFAWHRWTPEYAELLCKEKGE